MKNKRMIIASIIFLLGVLLGIILSAIFSKNKEASIPSKKTDASANHVTEDAATLTEDAFAIQITSEGVTITSDATDASESAQHTTTNPNDNTASSNSTKSEKEQTTASSEPNINVAKPSKTKGALHVSGSKLVDSNGNPIQLKGISTHGIGWFPDYINEAFFHELSTDWNADVIRLAMYTAEYNGYCSGGNKEQLKNLVKKGVEYATKNNLYVIIDWHILSDGNPHINKEEAKAFFSEMSALYADYNNVFYEICNEPNGGTSWSQIKAYAEEIIPVIRSNDADGIILVGTPNWSQYVNEAAANPITGYSNIMYTLHFYADTHRDSLRHTMKNAVSAGLPIFVTEYGICDASGNGAINTAQANEWVSTMNSLGISYVAWNISNKNETSAIFNSSCKKISGFSQEDLSASGKWLYEMLTGKTNLKGHNSNSTQQNDSSSSQQNPSGTNSSSEQQNQNASSENNSFSSNVSSAVTNATLTYELTLVNQWESNGEYFYQYNTTVKNNSGSSCCSWNISIPFNGTIKLSNGWNGNYTINGQTLTITSLDYNGALAPGSSTGDIGFIISGNGSLAAK